MYKRAGFFGMALETGCITGGSGAQLPGLKSAMRIVAIAALHHSFVDAMMKRTIELLFGLQMAAVAELWLLLPHQELGFLGMVRGMAVDAAHIVLQVRGTGKIAVLFSVAVAIQATLAGRLGGDRERGGHGAGDVRREPGVSGAAR